MPYKGLNTVEHKKFSSVAQKSLKIIQGHFSAFGVFYSNFALYKCP